MSGEDAYEEAHRLRHANIELNFDLDAARKRIADLEAGLEQSAAALELGRTTLGGALSQIVGLSSTIRDLEEQARIAQSQRLGLEAAADRYAERARKGQESYQEAVFQSLEQQIKVQDAATRIATALGYLDQAEYGCTRWEHPLPVPGWVGDLRTILGGTPPEPVKAEQRQQCRRVYQISEHVRAACLRALNHQGDHDHLGEQ